MIETLFDQALYEIGYESRTGEIHRDGYGLLYDVEVVTETVEEPRPGLGRGENITHIREYIVNEAVVCFPDETNIDAVHQFENYLNNSI